MDRRTLISGTVPVTAWYLTGASARAEAPQDSPNEVISGAFDVHTNGGRISITNADAPFTGTHAVLQVVNEGEVSCGFRVQAYWTGSTDVPYQNHDASLFEVFNKTESDSRNRSWAGSFCNAFNDIPSGVTDTGTRVGIIGWATSVAHGTYKHSGILSEQVGVYGTAGFQSPGSGESAVVQEAVGVRGVIINDSVGSTIQRAYAGQFVSTASVGEVESNIAVYASAEHGKTDNYSFFGNTGRFYNADAAQFGGQVRVKDETSQSQSSVSARAPGNSYEFGHPDRQGYASNLGATASAGFPFIAFCAEADQSGDTFRTRGKPGALMWSDLKGSVVFGRIEQSDDPGQTPIESARFTEQGNLKLAKRPVLPVQPPATPTSEGGAGEIAYDEHYFYVCVSDNRWKRFALSSWGDAD